MRLHLDSLIVSGIINQIVKLHVEESRARSPSEQPFRLALGRTAVPEVGTADGFSDTCDTGAVWGASEKIGRERERCPVMRKHVFKVVILLLLWEACRHPYFYKNISMDIKG